MSTSSSNSISLKLLFDTREFLLENRRLRLGRSDHLDITIKGDPLISSNHCTITNGVLLDAGSTNGTYLNSQRVVYNKKMQLQHGDVITLGETKLRIVEIKDGDPPIGEDTAPPGTTPSIAGALTATMRENKDRRRVGFADDGAAPGAPPNVSERSGTPNEARPDSDATQPQHNNGIIGHDGNGDSYVPSSRASVELNNDHHATSHDGSSSDDDDRNAGIAPSDSKSNRGPTPKRLVGAMNRTKKAVTKAPTARVSALAQALAAERTEMTTTPVDNTNGIIASDHSGIEDPLSWLPRHGSNTNGNDDGVPRRSPFAISADAFDNLSHVGAATTISTGAVSPAPSELTGDEARIWELQRALQKSDAALSHLKKTSSQQQRNRTMSAHKAKMEQLEAKCQSLEFQLLYGDTQKDRDIEELKEALRIAISTPSSSSLSSSSSSSSSSLAPSHAPLPVPVQLTARLSNGCTPEDVTRLRAELQQLRAEATARTAELATVRDQHHTALDHSVRLRSELEAAQRQVQVSSAVAAAATAAAAASPAIDNNGNGNSSSSNSSNNGVTDRLLTEMNKKLDNIDGHVTTIARDHGAGPFSRQQSMLLLVLVIMMAIINRLF